MSSDPIVEHLDVIEDIGPGEFAGFVHPFFDPFVFQLTEERFGHHIDAPVERFLRSLKTERIRGTLYPNHLEAQCDINDYIANFYNAMLHSDDGGPHPAQRRA